MLEVGDHDNPRVDEEVRDAVDEHHLLEAPDHGPVGEAADDEGETNVRPDDLPLVVLAEDDGRRQEVVRVRGVTLLTSRVHDKVQGEADELVHAHPEDGHRDVVKRLGEERLRLLGNGDAHNLILVGSLGQATLLAGTRDEHLVAGQATSRGVVTAVRDAPGMVRHKEGRVDEPADGVVDRLAAREGLVAALVAMC